MLMSNGRKLNEVVTDTTIAVAAKLLQCRLCMRRAEGERTATSLYASSDGGWAVKTGNDRLHGGGIFGFYFEPPCVVHALCLIATSPCKQPRRVSRLLAVGMLHTAAPSAFVCSI